MLQIVVIHCLSQDLFAVVKPNASYRIPNVYRSAQMNLTNKIDKTAPSPVPMFKNNCIVAPAVSIRLGSTS